MDLELHISALPESERILALKTAIITLQANKGRLLVDIPASHLDKLAREAGLKINCSTADYGNSYMWLQK